MKGIPKVARRSAAETCGTDRQTLRDWVHRHNAAGLAGLSNRRAAPRFDPGQAAEPESWLEAGPDPAVDGVARWRLQVQRARIAPAFGVVSHERTVGKYPAGIGRQRLSARRRHPGTVSEAQEVLEEPRRCGSRCGVRDREGQIARNLVPG